MAVSRSTNTRLIVLQLMEVHYNAKVIDVNELIDQFAYGIQKHPLSVRNFIRFAREISVSLCSLYTWLGEE